MEMAFDYNHDLGFAIVFFILSKCANATNAFTNSEIVKNENKILVH